jgi:hypothetical protein
MTDFRMKGLRSQGMNEHRIVESRAPTNSLSQYLIIGVVGVVESTSTGRQRLARLIIMDLRERLILPDRQGI